MRPEDPLTMTMEELVSMDDYWPPYDYPFHDILFQPDYPHPEED